MPLKVSNSRTVKKSIWLALIEKSPRIIMASAVLICVCKAKPGDMPKMVEALTKSEVFALAGWIVAGVVIVVAIAAVALYIKLKPK